MILDELAAHARERVAADKAKIPLEDMKAQAEALPKGDFRRRRTQQHRLL